MSVLLVREPFELLAVVRPSADIMELVRKEEPFRVIISKPFDMRGFSPRTPSVADEIAASTAELRCSMLEWQSSPRTRTRVPVLFAPSRLTAAEIVLLIDALGGSEDESMSKPLADTLVELMGVLLTPMGNHPWETLGRAGRIVHRALGSTSLISRMRR